MGTFAALCMGVALSGIMEMMRELGFVGRYKSSLVTSICSANANNFQRSCSYALLTMLLRSSPVVRATSVPQQ